VPVAPDELVQLLRHAQGAAAERVWSTLRCQDIMTPDPMVEVFRWSLAEAMAIMKRLSIKALPLVDQLDHVVGILTQTDLVRALSGVVERPHPGAKPSLVA
jgi:CBS-domain-containing membrane protein